MATSKLKGAVCLIASGAKNLGGVCAHNIVERGGKVVLCDTEAESGEKIQEALGNENCLFVPADLTREKDVEKVIALTAQNFGRLDVTINCPTRARTFKILSEKELKKYADHNTAVEKEKSKNIENIFKENLTSTFNVCRLSAGLMAENKPDVNGQRGVIINKSHSLAFGSSLAPYTMSQSAIIGMTLPMARDLNDLGIRVNSIAIGFLDYQIHRTQNGKIEKPIFSLMTFPHKLGSSQTFFHLCEKIIDNPYVNGEVIKLDAGVNTILL
ncbi:3-hydroxyacyl-CoA dehydrogenase type-2-like [Ostrea edulis]|uniref:3-hydroxyacyl-CoA dehydrogenase type-2-like n=1 Tax=Ostrea edulis TaxID=37623 RepID=UPI0024AF7347|nr:3-hydroxyacyl-CoA dehydrogenase type-2-like [Ostrea edulis]